MAALSEVWNLLDSPFLRSNTCSVSLLASYVRMTVCQSGSFEDNITNSPALFVSKDSEFCFTNILNLRPSASKSKRFSAFPALDLKTLTGSLASMLSAVFNRSLIIILCRTSDS